ncbi:MAG TPA: hypothetical protein VEA61_08825 [Allosphingosinicella sp.]|nr:hypothetical protein [Allosphingosinicella sp.]
MTMPQPHLSPLTDVKFEQLQLDPNNPRIAPEPAPGYDDPDKLFDPKRQEELTQEVFDAYQASELEQRITRLGWTPIDPIIVWRHPKRQDVVVVVEGNTRTAILRKARTRLETARNKLEKMKAGGRFTKDAVDDQAREVERLEALVNATKKVAVQFVQADDAKTLAKELPRLLGVRHITGAKDWTPYAKNLYITALYEDFYRARYKDGRRLRLEDDLISEVAEVFSISVADARRAIQTANAFAHFKVAYEERVQEAGNQFTDKDQYFFDQILRNSYARKEFAFEKDDLQLSEEASEALYQWAFSKPRSGDDDDPDSPNPNVFRKAEDMRVWQALSRYDNKNATSFASQLDVSNPENAPSIEQLNLDKGQHKARHTPMQTLTSLLDGLKELKAETLRAQALILAPVLKEIRDTADDYLDMINSQRAA